jgi:Predicted phosphohydrolases
MNLLRFPFSLALFLALLSPVSSVNAKSPAPSAAAGTPQQTASVGALPNKDGSFKFIVFGDFGTGASIQYQLAEQMAKLHEKFKFDTAILVGDNLYGSERPQDFQQKFEIPYKPLLDAGVKFYASLGNHDAREQRFYKLFNMDGKLYYTYSPKSNVKFFFLESTYMEPEQVKWVEKELKAANNDWKIAVFHHPLYSSAKYHGSEVRLREVLEPIFVENNVSLVFTGHDHVYERLKPQNDIQYFVTGSGGKLRSGDINRGSGLTASGFDTDLAFLAGEIIDDEMYFTAISRSGQVVDSGVVRRRQAKP